MPPGPACRYPDPITHDSVTPCGATAPLPAGPDPNLTMIELLPAAHMMHGVVCTGVIAAGIVHPPPPPTPPIPIILGSPTVFINHFPAARWIPSLDTGGCAVFLGNPALAATRTTLIGDGGGGGVTPRPITMVNINGQWVMQFGTSIYIFPDASDPGYQGKVAEAYQRLNQLSPTARNAFSAIEGSGKWVSVTKYSNPADPFNATATPDGNGNTVIRWDPAVNTLGGAPGTVGAEQAPGADIILAHETFHAAHNATGTAGTGPTTPEGVNTSEERNTVGLPAQTYQHPNPADPLNGTALPDTTGLPYTENGVRNDYRAAGVNSPVTGQPAPPRTGYYVPNGKPF